MTYLLWVLQALLGLGFLAAGALKLSQPYPALAAQLVWVSDVPEALVRGIGLAEGLGGVGLLVPAATRLWPGLTPLAAGGLALVMLLATGFHLGRGEPGLRRAPGRARAARGVRRLRPPALAPIRPRVFDPALRRGGHGPGWSGSRSSRAPGIRVHPVPPGRRPHTAHRRPDRARPRAAYYGRAPAALSRGHRGGTRRSRRECLARPTREVPLERLSKRGLGT